MTATNTDIHKTMTFIGLEILLPIIAPPFIVLEKLVGCELPTWFLCSEKNLIGCGYLLENLPLSVDHYM